jgi:voltage-gated potassium channel Kch
MTQLKHDELMSPKPDRTQSRRESLRPEGKHLRGTVYDIIFEADTPAGRGFDIGLLVAILASITIESLQTVTGYTQQPQILTFFNIAEWVLTFLFTIEYVLRLYCVRKPLRYVFSFWGLIDLLSIMPSYVTYFIGTSSRSFVIIRSVRLLRVFRVLKLWRMMNEADELASAIWKVRDKIIVFVAVVLVAVTISGTLMYHIETYSQGIVDESPQDLAVVLNIDPVSIGKVLDQDNYIVLDNGTSPLKLHQLLSPREYLNAQTEYKTDTFSADIGPDAIIKMIAALNLDEMVDQLQGRVDTATTITAKETLQQELDVVTSIREVDRRPESQFTSIPQSMYWAIVTMTTVGYGDVVPQTAVGKVISALLILLGYSLIIVPSTFVSAEFIQQHQKNTDQTLPCDQCAAVGQRDDADFCYRCGKRFQR